MAYIGQESAITDVAASLQSESVLRYCQAAMCALILYEHLTTIDQEIEAMWWRRFSVVPLLFFLMRWSSLILSLFFAITWVNELEIIASCKTMLIIPYGFITLLTILSSVFTSVRVYSLNSRNVRITSAVTAFSLVAVAINVYVFVRSFEIIAPVLSGTTCILGIALPMHTYTMLIAISRTCAIVSDGICITATLLRAGKHVMRARKSGAPSSLLTLVVRDGLMYFCILAGLNLLQIIATALNKFTYGIVLTAPMSAILCCRFLLNLSRSVRREEETRRSNASSTYHYQRHGFFDNIGAPMQWAPGWSRSPTLVDGDGPSAMPAEWLNTVSMRARAESSWWSTQGTDFDFACRTIVESEVPHPH